MYLRKINWWKTRNTDANADDDGIRDMNCRWEREHISVWAAGGDGEGEGDQHGGGGGGDGGGGRKSKIFISSRFPSRFSPIQNQGSVLAFFFLDAPTLPSQGGEGEGKRDCWDVGMWGAGIKP